MLALEHAADVLLVSILWTSLQAMVLVGLIALLIRVVPRIPVAARCALWWLIALQVIFGLCWQAPISVPASLAPLSTSAALHGDFRSIDSAAAVADQVTVDSSSPTHPVGADQATFIAKDERAFIGHWRIGLAFLWALGLAVQLPMLAAQRRRLLALLDGAKRPTEGGLQAVTDHVAQQMGLRRSPRVLVSPKIESPLIMGLWHPVILWPAAHSLGENETALAVAHELAHLQRGDLWFGVVPALAQWLFFFHPLVRRAVREYALYREAACDARVLDCGNTPREYGRLLLRMGVARPLQCGLGSASPTFNSLKRRLMLLNQPPNTPARLWGWLLVAVIFAVALPYRAVIASQSTALASASGKLGATTSSTIPKGAKPTASHSVARMPPFPRFPSSGFSANHVHVDIDSGARVGIALFDGDLVVVEGGDADMASAKRLYKASHGPTLWFRHGGTVYLSHDRETTDRARKIFEPVIMARQDAARLEGEKWQVKGPLEGLQSRQHDVEERTRKLQADPTAPAAAERLTSLKNQKREIETSMADLQRRLTALKPRLDAMSKRLQQVTARADQQVAWLVDAAAKSGKAQKVRS